MRYTSTPRNGSRIVEDQPAGLAAARVVAPEDVQDPDAEVAQGGHDLGPAAGADLGGVFTVADVADVVQHLDLPVAAYPGGELGWGRPRASRLVIA